MWNPGGCLCHVSLCKYKYLNIGLLQNSDEFIHSHVLNRNVFLMLKVFWLFMLQHKLFVLLPNANFIESFSQGVVIRDKVKWLRADFTAFSMSQHILILPTILMCALITYNRCCVLCCCNYVPMEQNVLRAEQKQLSVGLSHCTGNWTVCWIFMKFAVAVHKQRLSSKRPFCETVSVTVTLLP